MAAHEAPRAWDGLHRPATTTVRGVPGPRSETGPVLTARLAVPQQRQALVPREHLLDRLSQGVEGPLTLVRGPAGAGKTFLVASWVTSGRPPHPVAWLTLDAEADAPGVFWAYFLESLRGAGIVLDSEIGVPARAEEIDRFFLARLAAALSELPEPVILVLDDFDRVSSQRVTAQLDYVVTYSTPRLRLVLVTRRHHPPGFHRHRVAGETVEIGPEDLAFTVGEARQLMRLHGLDLPADSVEALAARTEGWVTGLRLSALAVAHGTAPERLLREFAGRHGDIAEFMLAEVLQELPPETQDLLLRTSILERVHVDLADALTGRSDGERILEELARASTFVRAIPGAEPWYRYHGLFAEALQGRLRSTAAGLVPELHRTASQWLADNGELAAAVTHAVAAGDWHLAAAHVVDHLAVAQLLVGLETQRLAQVFVDLPADEPSAETALVEAALAMARFEADRCVDALDRADARSAEVPARRRPALRLGIAGIRVIVSRLTGDLEAARAAAVEAQDLMRTISPDRLARSPQLEPLVLSSLGTVLLWSGRVDAAEEALRAGLAAASGPGTEYPRSNCLGQLAVVHYLRGDLRQARECALESLEQVSRSGLSPVTRVPVGHLAAAGVAWEWGDLAALRSHVEQAGGSVVARYDPSVGSTVALLRGRHHLARGDAEGALACLDAAVATCDRLPPDSFVPPLVLAERAAAFLALGRPERARSLLTGLAPDDPLRRLGTARVHLALGKPAAALSSLGDAPDDPGIRTPLLVRMNLVAAQALQQAGGDAAAARRRLERALALAKPQGLRRPFLEAGSWVRETLARDHDLAAPHGWLGRGLVGTDRRPPRGGEVPPLVVEELSARELDVLRLVAQPMSTREAAEELHLSVNTVKTHLRSIYRKLAAPSRTKAVRRARTLGLL